MSEFVRFSVVMLTLGLGACISKTCDYTMHRVDRMREAAGRMVARRTSPEVAGPGKRLPRAASVPMD